MREIQLGDGSEAVVVRHDSTAGGVRLSIYRTGAYMSVHVTDEVAAVIAAALTTKEDESL